MLKEGEYTHTFSDEQLEQLFIRLQFRLSEAEEILIESEDPQRQLWMFEFDFESKQLKVKSSPPGEKFTSWRMGAVIRSFQLGEEGKQVPSEDNVEQLNAELDTEYGRPVHLTNDHVMGLVTEARVHAMAGDYWERQGVVEEGSIVLRCKGQVLEGMSRFDLLSQMKVDGRYLVAKVGTPVLGFLKGPAEVVFRKQPPKVIQKEPGEEKGPENGDGSEDEDPLQRRTKVKFPKEKITKSEIEEAQKLAERMRTGEAATSTGGVDSSESEPD